MKEKMDEVNYELNKMKKKMEKEFDLSKKIKVLRHETRQAQAIWIEDIKEFIKIGWKNECHFLWDLLRDLSDNKNLNLSDFWIEKQVQKRLEQKDKLVGDKLI